MAIRLFFSHWITVIQLSFLCRKSIFVSKDSTKKKQFNFQIIRFSPNFSSTEVQTWMLRITKVWQHCIMLCLLVNLAINGYVHSRIELIIFGLKEWKTLLRCSLAKGPTVIRKTTKTILHSILLQVRVSSLRSSEIWKVSDYNFFGKSDKIHVHNKEFFLDKAKIAEILIYYGAQMELRNKAGNTALHRAFDWSGNFTIILKWNSLTHLIIYCHFR